MFRIHFQSHASVCIINFQNNIELNLENNCNWNFKTLCKVYRWTHPLFALLSTVKLFIFLITRQAVKLWHVHIWTKIKRRLNFSISQENILRFKNDMYCLSRRKEKGLFRLLQQWRSIVYTLIILDTYLDLSLRYNITSLLYYF